MRIPANQTRRKFIKESAKLSVLGLSACNSALFIFTGCGKKMNWQIGCYTRPWDQYEYKVALDTIAEAGYHYAGLMTTKSESRLVVSTSTSQEEARKVGEEVKQRGLKVLSVYGGQFGADESVQMGIDGLKILIDNCVACGSQTLLLGGTGKPEIVDQYYKVVSECCDYAAEKGVGLVLKPHGGLNATGPQCRKTIEQVGHKNFRLWYDPGNIFYYSDGNLDPVEDAETVNGLVTGMCIKDYLPPKNVLVTPGSGKVNFPQVFQKLVQGGFTGGPLVVECLNRGELPQLLTEARKARLFLEELVKSY
jgi:sugar phosphate isomerase/epimerase